MFLNEQRVTTADTYGALLEREVPVLADAPIYRLVHDDLSEHWNPRWFAEFAEHAARHGLGYVGEADLFSLRTEMLPEGVEPLVWELAGRRPDRVREPQRPADRAPLPPERALPRRRARSRAEPSPERAAAAALGGAPERRAARGRAARRRVRRARPPAPARASASTSCASALGRRAARAGRGAAGRLPARAADAARRAAARGERAGRASARLPLARWQAAQRRRHGLARLHAGAHGGARGAAADHAARRHARPRGDPRRAAGPRGRRARPTRTSSATGRAGAVVPA